MHSRAFCIEFTLDPLDIYKEDYTYLQEVIYENISGADYAQEQTNPEDIKASYDWFLGTNTGYQFTNNTAIIDPKMCDKLAHKIKGKYSKWLKKSLDNTQKELNMLNSSLDNWARDGYYMSSFSSFYFWSEADGVLEEQSLLGVLTRKAPEEFLVLCGVYDYHM